MKSFQKILLLAFLAVLAFGCENASQTPSAADAEKESRPVRVMLLAEDSIARTLEYTANLMAYEELHYAPAQPGRIQKINVEAADRVQKGQILVEMDRTQLNQARLQLEDARRNYARLDTLFRQQSIAKQQLDQAKMAFEMAETNVAYLEENTTLTAPFSGLVTDTYYESGELYSGAPNTQAGKAAVLTLMQISPLKAQVSISERYFPLIREGMKAEVFSDIYPDLSFSGVIEKVYPTIDAMTRTFRVEVRVENPGEKLRPGMFARVRIKLGTAPALRVPAIAIVKQEGTNNRYVFVYEDGVARKIDVVPGTRMDEMVEVISDELKSGMQLIVAGQARLMDGDPVSIVE